MKVEIKKIDQIIFIPENDADKAIIDYWDDKYHLLQGGSRRDKNVCEHNEAEACGCKSEKICFAELQTIEVIKKINETNI